MMYHYQRYIWLPDPGCKGEAKREFDCKFRLSLVFMSGTAPVCGGCKGKWPIEVGQTHCPVCASIFQLSGYLWSPRFPPQLGLSATKLIRDNYHLQLESAEQFLSLQGGAGALQPGAPATGTELSQEAAERVAASKSRASPKGEVAVKKEPISPVESPKGGEASSALHPEEKKPKEEAPSSAVTPPPEEEERRSKRKKKRRSRSEESSHRRERRHRKKEKRKSPVRDKERRPSPSEASYEEDYEDVVVEPEPTPTGRSNRAAESFPRPAEPAYPPGYRGGWRGPIPARDRREERGSRQGGGWRQKPPKANKGQKKRERQHQLFGQGYRRGR